MTTWPRSATPSSSVLASKRHPVVAAIVVLVVALTTVSTSTSTGVEAATGVVRPDEHSPRDARVAGDEQAIAAHGRSTPCRAVPLGFTATSIETVPSHHTVVAVDARPHVPTTRRCGGVGRRAPPLGTS